MRERRTRSRVYVARDVTSVLLERMDIGRGSQIEIRTWRWFAGDIHILVILELSVCLVGRLRINLRIVGSRISAESSTGDYLVLGMHTPN